MTDSKLSFYNFEESSREAIENVRKIQCILWFTRIQTVEKTTNPVNMSFSWIVCKVKKIIIHRKKVVQLSFKEHEDLLLKLYAKHSNKTTNDINFIG